MPLGPEHLDLLVELDGDPEVMRYLIGRARTATEARDHWGPLCASTAADAVGLGRWVGFGPDGAFVGWWDATPDLPVVQRPRCASLGWRLGRANWRQGLATEGARAVVDHAFGVVGVARLVAETMAVNAGSRGVMRGLGMRHVRTEVRTWDDPLPGAEEGEVVYELTREDWLGR